MKSIYVGVRYVYAAVAAQSAAPFLSPETLAALPPDLPAAFAMAYADSNMVETVIRNLIANALKFTPIGGTVTMSAQAHPDLIEVAVADTGIGITPAQIEHLFRLDKRTSRPGTAGEQGTGLGLILCKELIEKNGGTIRVESAVSQGTTFRVTLPRVSNEANERRHIFVDIAEEKY